MTPEEGERFTKAVAQQQQQAPAENAEPTNTACELCALYQGDHDVNGHHPMCPTQRVGYSENNPKSVNGAKA